MYSGFSDSKIPNTMDDRPDVFGVCDMTTRTNLMLMDDRPDVFGFCDLVGRPQR